MNTQIRFGRVPALVAAALVCLLVSGCQHPNITISGQVVTGNSGPTFKSTTFFNGGDILAWQDPQEPFVITMTTNICDWESSDSGQPDNVFYASSAKVDGKNTVTCKLAKKVAGTYPYEFHAGTISKVGDRGKINIPPATGCDGCIISTQ